MDLFRVSKIVLEYFKKIDQEINTFKTATNFKCKENCGYCCNNTGIEATILEFIPLAVELYKKDRLIYWHERLENLSPKSPCIFFNPNIFDHEKGYCNIYHYRGLICRLFGFSAVLDKYENPKLAACNAMIKNSPQLIKEIQENINKGLSVPLIYNSYSFLNDINPQLSNKLYQINYSIKLAFEQILFIAKYRKKPA